VALSYLDPRGLESHADACPLGLEKSGRITSLAAFVEAQDSFRSFRLDRLISVTLTGERFALTEAQSLAAYRARQSEAIREDG
jgi:predicted DNA-binding transcriptional regulator YafY